MTLNEIETHCTEFAYQFIIQVLRDLWFEYGLDYFANDPHRQKEARLSDVTDFRIWLYNQKTTAVQRYLPKSDAALQKIIRYCLTKKL